MPIILQVAQSKAQSSLLIELLHPGADLIRNFNLQDLLASPGEGHVGGERGMDGGGRAEA